jgi:FKBP-type peptidyl-prolyl cis-trans isomerase FkpA
MRRSIIGLFTFVIFFIVGCNHSEYPGFKEAESGLLYKIHDNQKGEKAKPGDYLTVEMTYFTNEDSLLFDAQGQSFPLRLEEPVFRGDINEALALMGKGDSATFVIRADSFLIMNAKLTSLPSFVTDQSKVIFHVKLHNIQTLEELEQEELMKQVAAQEKEYQAILSYVESNDITVQPNNVGLYIIPTKNGNGAKPKTGQTVIVHYTGKFLNGEKFDSSYDRNRPTEFQIGLGQVISGWDLGISQMRVGGEATLIIPSDLGYGKGRGEIPPYTPLVFEVKLINVK